MVHFISQRYFRDERVYLIDESKSNKNKSITTWNIESDRNKNIKYVRTVVARTVSGKLVSIFPEII